MIYDRIVQLIWLESVRLCTVFVQLCISAHSSVANRHLLKAISRVGAGSYEFYDSKFKSKWEDKVNFMILISSLNLSRKFKFNWEDMETHTLKNKNFVINKETMKSMGFPNTGIT